MRCGISRLKFISVMCAHWRYIILPISTVMITTCHRGSIPGKYFKGGLHACRYDYVNLYNLLPFHYDPGRNGATRRGAPDG
jgi:hypothetical protein